MKAITHFLKRMAKAIRLEVQEHTISFVVYIILRMLVILMLCFKMINNDYESVLMCLLTLILLLVPSFAQVTFKIELPTMLEILILCFIFSAQILGEICNFYEIIPFWDTILHTINGFLAAAIGFSLINILNNSEKKYFYLSPIFVIIVSFCFSMTIGVLWEFFEFGMDYFFDMNTQKNTLLQAVNIGGVANNSVSVIKDISSVVISYGQGESVVLPGYVDIGLYDTMSDLIVNFIGAFVFSICGYFYIKNPVKSIFLKKVIPHRKSADKDYFKRCS